MHGEPLSRQLAYRKKVHVTVANRVVSDFSDDQRGFVEDSLRTATAFVLLDSRIIGLRNSRVLRLRGRRQTRSIEKKQSATGLDLCGDRTRRFRQDYRPTAVYKSLRAERQALSHVAKHENIISM